jgi:hypothetical protein
MGQIDNNGVSAPEERVLKVLRGFGLQVAGLSRLVLSLDTKIEGNDAKIAAINDKLDRIDSVVRRLEAEIRPEKKSPFDQVVASWATDAISRRLLIFCFVLLGTTLIGTCGGILLKDAGVVRAATGIVDHWLSTNPLPSTPP